MTTVTVNRFGGNSRDLRQQCRIFAHLVHSASVAPSGDLSKTEFFVASACMGTCHDLQTWCLRHRQRRTRRVICSFCAGCFCRKAGTLNRVLFPFRGGNGLSCQATQGMDGTREYVWCPDTEESVSGFFSFTPHDSRNQSTVAVGLGSCDRSGTSTLAGGRGRLHWLLVAACRSARTSRP